MGGWGRCKFNACHLRAEVPPVVRSAPIKDHTHHRARERDETMRRRRLCTCTYSGHCERLQIRTHSYLQERKRWRLEKRASSSGFFFALVALNGLVYGLQLRLTVLKGLSHKNDGKFLAKCELRSSWNTNTQLLELPRSRRKL